MKVILDTNIWISFLIGHQTQLIRKILSDVRLDVYVCDSLIAEIKDVAGRDKIRKYINSSDVEDLMAIIYAFCQFTVIQKIYICFLWLRLLALISLSVVTMI